MSRNFSNLVKGRIKTLEKSMDLSELTAMLDELKESEEQVMMDVDYWVLGADPIKFEDYPVRVAEMLLMGGLLSYSPGFNTRIREEIFRGTGSEKHYIEIVKSKKEGERIVMSSRAKLEYTLPR